MLKKAISTSRRLAELKTHEARLIYIMLLPHLDIEGRFSGDPSVIKGSVVPRIMPIDVQCVSDSLSDLHKVGMLEWYKDDGDLFIQVRKFKEHQHLRDDRERPSDIPPPTGHLPDSSGACPPEVNIREVKRTLSSGRASALPYADMFDKCYSEYPRKEGRKRAHRAYAARRKEGVSAEDLQTATEQYAVQCSGKERQFIKLPATFYGPDEHWKEILAGPCDDARMPDRTCPDPCGNIFEPATAEQVLCHGCLASKADARENALMGNLIGDLAKRMEMRDD